MNYWLIKSEPETYSFADLQKHGTDYWDGVRNYQARNNMRDMKKNDKVLFYHSGKSREVVGLCTVARTAYQDPTTEDDRWVAVDFRAGKILKRPVSLKEIKAESTLKDIALIRNSRLSVMPLTREHYDAVLKLSETAP